MSQRFYDARGRLYDPEADMIEVPAITRAQLRGASPWALNVRGCPAVGDTWQGDAPSTYQNLPADADTLLKWLGAGAYPAGVGVANVLGIYQADTASPLVDSLGLGPNLVAAAAPLTARECIGLGQAGSFTSKVGVEFVDGSGMRFADAGNAFMDVADGTVRSFLIVLRWNPNSVTASGRIISKEVGNLWTLAATPGANALVLYGTAGYGQQTGIIIPFTEGAWHSIVGVMDAQVAGAHFLRLRTDLGDNSTAAFAGSMNNAASFSVGSAGGSASGFQLAYVACFDVEITSAMRAAFWRHAQVYTPFAHARLNPLIAPISASRVAAWAGGNVGQAALGYDASLVTATDGNGLGSGYVCEDGATFEPIGSDSFLANLGVITCAAVIGDGPSGMRDGIRLTMAANWVPGVNEGYLPNAGVNIVGASNVAWRGDTSYRRATVGTTARFGFEFDGDPGGQECFTLVSDAATPVDWTRGGGTATPVGAAHNAVYDIFGAALNLDDCDFGEPILIKNRTTPSLAWRRVGTAAAAVTSTPAYSVANGTNRYYNALRGEEAFIIGGFALTTGATFFSFGAVGAAGAMVCDYAAGPQLRLRIYDSVGALVATILGGPLTAARRKIEVLWDAGVPLRGIGGAYAALVVDGVVVGAWLAPWTPAVTAPATLYYGCDSAAANAARCFMESA